MTLIEMNNKLKNGALVTISPWDIGGNGFKVKVLSVAPGCTVEYGWTSLDGYPVEPKLRVVSESTWDSIVAQLSDDPKDEE